MEPFAVLAFFAHPDDETMLCGGTLALLAQQGARVHILIATRGEGGEMGEPPICARDELARFREAELRCAGQALGAASVSLLDYIDPLVGPEDTLFAFTENVDELADQLLKAARQTGSQAILTHGVNGEYGHPAHKLAHQAARLAVSKAGDAAPLLYTIQGIYEGHPNPRLANEDEPAHFVIDITPYLPQKLEAALCHRTQHALFIRHGSEQAQRTVTVQEVIQPLESLHRAWPPVNSEPADPLADRVRASGCIRNTTQG